jgi:predicted PurR-regulated permease PerM
MLEDLKTEFASIKYLSHLLFIAIVIYLAQVSLQILNTFSDIVLIIVFAWILNFILGPLVLFVNRQTKIPLIFSTVFVYILFGLVISVSVYLLIPTVLQQIGTLSKILPLYLESSSPQIQKASQTFLTSLGDLTYIIPQVSQFLIYFITILVLSFYMIIEKKTINSTIHKILPRSWLPHMDFLEEVVDRTMTLFFRVQVIFGLISGVMTFAVLLLFGIDFAPSTAVVAGLLTLIPVIGVVLALIPPFLVSLVQDPSKALFILAILLVAQQLVYNLLGPKLIGQAFKIHPIIVLISLLVGFKVAGFIGSVFAIPVVSIATIVGKEVIEKRREE